MSLLKDLQGLNAAYAEMQQKEAYTVTAADKKGNTPAYQGYKAGKKNVKTGEPMYKAADHLKKEDRESKLWDEVAKMLTELHELRGVQYKVVPLEEKKAAKDYDGDGKIESGKDEYFGSKDKAIKKAMGKKVKEVDESVVKGTSTNAAGEKIPWKVTTSGGRSTVSDKYGKRDVTAKVRQPKKVDAPKGSKMREEYSDEISPETKKLIESGKFTQVEIDALVEAERSLADRLARKRKVYDKTTKKAMDFARDEGEASGHARYRMGSISREMDGIKAKMNKK